MAWDQLGIAIRGFNFSNKFPFTGKVILYTLPILAFIGIALTLIFRKLNLTLLGSYLAIPMFFAPIIYSKNYKNPYKNSNLNNRSFLFLLIVYFLSLSISIILLYVFDIRPYSYYVIITLMSTSILFEIILFDITDKKNFIIILQIGILLLDIIWGINLKYYFYIDRTDVIGHVWYIKNLLELGHVTDIFEEYTSFPLWHILVSSFYLIIGESIPVRKTMFFINGFISIFLVIVVYLASLKLLKNKKLALLTSLFVGIDPNVIIHATDSIPKSVISFFEVTLILLLLDSNTKKKVLVVILTITTIMYHTASMPFIIAILLLIYILQKFYVNKKEDTFLTWNYFILAISSSLMYYLFFANKVFRMMIGNVFAPPDVGVLTKSVVYAPLNELFNYLQYMPIIFFLIIGTLSILLSEKREKMIYSNIEKTFSISGLLLIFVTFPGPALLLNKLAGNFNLDRFAEYSFYFIDIIATTGFAWLYYRSGRSKKIIVMLFVIMVFLSISNDFSAQDNPIVKRPFYTFFLLEEETVALNHISKISGANVMADYVTERYIWFSSYKSKFVPRMLEVDPKNKTILRSFNKSDLILIREQELNKRPLKLFTSETGKFLLTADDSKINTDYYYRESPIWNSLKSFNRIYNSGGVSGYN